MEAHFDHSGRRPAAKDDLKLKLVDPTYSWVRSLRPVLMSTATRERTWSRHWYAWRSLHWEMVADAIQECGVMDALSKGYLKALMLIVYLNPDKPEE